MQRTLPLLNGHVSLRSALDDDDNVLQELSYPEKRIEFFAYLLMQRDTIENIVSFHLGLKRKQTCRIGEVKEWISGSFNVCIPVYINHWPAANRVLIRFPLPYKVGELEYPGNAEEKLRCEAATFIWLQENCPSVPIPNIWGFGLANGHSFTALGRVSFLSRLMWNLRRIASSIFHYSVPCRYVSRQCSYKLKSPYLVMDYIDSTQGVMLSESWEGLRHDQTRRKNLFRGLSRIILALARLPVERIGSLTIDNRSVIRLKNRPLTLRLQHLENQSVPTSIDRDIIYHSTDAYLLDLLAYHDSYLRHSPNSVQDELDGQAQLSTLTIMRAILPHFINRDFRRGPFVLSLTDLHQSNIFVDQNWNIKCLVDLEWACSRPVEMLHPPYWLTSRGVDQLEEGEHLDAFNNMHSEFMDAFAKEEESLFEKDARAFSLTDIIKWGLENGSFWYSHALDNPKGLYNIFLGHIQPIFAKLDDAGVDKLEQMVAPYWSADMQSFLAKKLKDQEEYQNKLRDAFAVSESDPKTNANLHTQ